MAPMITVTKEGERWIARFAFNYAIKDLVQAAGFSFDSADRLWYAADQAAVAKLSASDLVEVVVLPDREATHAAAQASIAASSLLKNMR